MNLLGEPTFGDGGTARSLLFQRVRRVGLLTAALLSFFCGTAFAQGAGSVVVNEQFSRPDAAGLGVADSGQPWTLHYGAAGIGNQEAVLGGFFTLASLDTGISTGDVAVTVTQPTAEFWLVFRFTDGGNYWRFGRWAGEPYRLQLVRSHTLEAPGVEALVTQPAAAGDRVKCSVRQTGIQCFVNEILVARTTDSFNDAATSVGLSSSQNAGGHFDSLIVTSPPPSPDLSISISGPASLTAGTVGTWTISVTNIGEQVSSNATIQLTTPDGFGGVSFGTHQCAASGSSYSCVVGPLTPGQAQGITMQATAPSTPGPVVLLASVSPSPEESALSNNHSQRTTTVRPTTAGPIILFDEFARPDQSTLAVAPSGQPWSLYYGAAGVAGEHAALGGYFTLAAIDAGVAPSDVSVTVIQPTAEFWLVFRFVDGGNYWRFGRWAGEPYRLQLVRNHTLDAPGVELVTTRQAEPGDVITCALLDSGIECSVNGVVVARTSDTYNRNASRVGLSSSQNAGGYFDDLFVAAPPPAPDLTVELAGPGTLATGSTGSWTATVRNVGQAASSAGNIALTVPPSLTGVVATGSNCTASGGGVFSCSLGAVGIGQSTSIAIQAVAPTTIGPVVIQSQIGGIPGELISSNNHAERTTVVRPAALGPIVVFDAFDRADQQELGTATTGQLWARHYGEALVADGQARLGGFFTLYALNAGIAASDLSVMVPEPTAEFWLVFRFTDGGNYWRFGRWAGEAYQLQLVRAHTLEAPGVETLTTRMAGVGDIIGCELRLSGIVCSVNGVPVARTTDAFNRTATLIGLSSSQHAGGHFDDLMVSAPPPAPDLTASVAGPATLTVGTAGSWAVTVRNVGAAAAPSGTVTIALPASFSSVTMGGTSCGNQSTTYVCAVAPLAVGQSMVITIQATASLLPGPAVVHGDVAPLPGEADSLNNHGQRVTTIRPAIAGAVVVLDGFTRPDQSAALGLADSGQAWTTYYGQAGVAAEQAQLGGYFTLAALNSGIAAADVYVTVVQPTAEFWLVFRFTDGGNYWRFGRWAGEAYQLQRVRAHTLGAPGVTTFVTRPPTAGDVVSCELRSGLIACSVNGTLVAQTTDTFNRTATAVGISSSQNAGGHFDDLMVTRPTPAPDLQVSVGGPAFITAATAGTWTATVRNVGELSSAAQNLVISLPTGLTGVSTSGPCAAPSGGTVQCTVGALVSGAGTTVTINASAPTTSGAVVVSADITQTAGETVLGNNHGSRTSTVRPAGAPAVMVVDEFTRPDQWEFGTADSGQVWTRHAGTSSISGEQAFLGGSFTLETLDAGIAASDLSVRVVEATAEFWLVMRFTDAGNYWRFGRSGGGPYRLQLVRANALEAPGVETLATQPANSGDLISCQLRHMGIECAVNGTPVARTIDPFNRGAAGVGLSSSQNAGGQFDDLIVIAAPPGPELRVSVNASSWLLPGEVQDLRISVRNTGQAASTASVASIAFANWATLPAGLPSGCIAGAVVACSVPSLAAGQTHILAISLSSSNTGTLNGSVTLHPPSITSVSYDAAAWTTIVRSNSAGVSDRFSRPDTATGLGTSQNGQTWQSLLGSFRISNNAAVATAAGSLTAVDRGFSFGTLDVTLGSGAADVAIAFRVVDANNYYKLSTDENGFYWFSRVVNGEPVPVEFQIQRRLVTPQVGDRIRIVVRPDDGIFAAVNGQHVVDGGDIRDMFATGWGLVGVSTSIAYSEFELRPEMESFETVDRFDLGYGSQINLATSGVLYPWVNWQGNRWMSYNGYARSNTVGYSYSAIEASTERATAKVALVTPGSAAWLLFRHSEDGTYFRFGHHGSAYEVGYVYQHAVTGMPVTVEQFATVAPQAGDRLEVRQSSDGSVECFVNGTLVLRFVAPNHSVRSTAYGIGAVGSATEFNDFVVSPPAY